MRAVFGVLAVAGLTACASPALEPTYDAELIGDELVPLSEPDAPEIVGPEVARQQAEAAVAECKAVELLDRVGQPGRGVEADLPAGSRVIEPGSIVTQDYLPQRINVDLDEAGNITRIWCG